MGSSFAKFGFFP